MHSSVTTTIYHQVHFIATLPLLMGITNNGVCLESNIKEVGYSYNMYATIIPIYLAGSLLL